MKYLPNIDSPTDLKKLSVDQLVELAEEIRTEIVSAVAETGGHLASNLGAVELTLALHYLFDTPDDRIIWDVSHQTYVHKLLTGRRDRIGTIRCYNGLAGFARREESEHDHFGAGHASTSISASLGFAVARDLNGDTNKVIAVIGDGAMTGGLAFEGMNNAGSLRKNLLVILNDNTFSISKNVGSISRYLTSIMADEKVNRFRREVWELTGKFKRPEMIRKLVHRIEGSLKSLIVPGMLFEEMGFRYFGPIDGHDLPLLIKTLQDLKQLGGPVLLHIATVKGKGYAPAEEDAFKFHGVSRFDPETGKSIKSGGGSGLPSYTDVFGRIMLELAERNPKVVAITAAMASGTGLVAFSEKYPDRFFDVGIAEGHATCFAAGLAVEGIKPYLTIYSTFMQRAYDQIIHDTAIQKLPVVVCMDRAGLVGNDGPTHHGVFDIAYLSTIPNVTVCAPKDGNELRSMLHHTANNEMSGMIAVRYPRDTVPVPMEEAVAPIEWGTWEWLTTPSEIVVLAVGSMVYPALSAAETLDNEGTAVSLVNARFVKPFDMTVLAQVARDARAIVTIEEAQLRGGFGQAVAEYLLSSGYTGKFKALGLTDSFVTHGDRSELLRDVRLDVAGITAQIRELVAHDAQSKTKISGGFFQRLRFKRPADDARKDGVGEVRLTGTDSK
ncbi:MAG: 1-deoxy-D-xylulose-5-phosphate synthase [candidate division Zixibacteria bacterium]|nr:1-deoxy-D-xylulose-5-phosphate synthase [candidate division Zixibacteria bacterium]